jgi:hypothetical protein
MEKEKVDLYRWIKNIIDKCKEWSKFSMVKCIDEWVLSQEVKLKRRHADA